MYYAIAILCGLLLGSTVALAKYFLIWRPYAIGRSDNLYGRMAISSGVNVATLLLVFLLRNLWPYSFYGTVIATALSLSAVGKYTLQKIDTRGK